MNENKINILSLFDGISCARVALERAGIKVDKYYSSEIDKYARVIKLLGEDRTREFISYCKERNIHSPAYFWGMWKNFNSNLKWEK